MTLLGQVARANFHLVSYEIQFDLWKENGNDPELLDQVVDQRCIWIEETSGSSSICSPPAEMHVGRT